MYMSIFVICELTDLEDVQYRRKASDRVCIIFQQNENQTHSHFKMTLKTQHFLQSN